MTISGTEISAVVSLGVVFQPRPRVLKDEAELGDCVHQLAERVPGIPEARFVALEQDVVGKALAQELNRASDDREVMALDVDL